MEQEGEKEQGLLSGGLPFGKYHLLRQIGKGGMAEVYLAKTPDSDQLVAIKVVKKALANKKHFLEMFVREGKLAIQLHHDAIVRTHEIGRVSTCHYICMEYVPGVDLSVLIKKCRNNPTLRLSLPHALFIALRACEGLHYAHELADANGRSLNLVNRDVNPANIRISFDGEVKLLDFGIAKAATGLNSEIGVLKGKIRHMSPEQVRSLPLDRRSDVFSTGIMLWEMLAQEKLFRGDSDFQLMNVVREAMVRPPSAINPRIPAEVDELVLKALQKDPRQRFQTADEMAVALREILSKYKFDSSELRQLVREACKSEIEQEQQAKAASKVDTAKLKALTPLSQKEGVEALDFSLVDSSVGDPQQEETKRKQQPRWIYALLAMAIVLFMAAIILLLAIKPKT